MRTRLFILAAVLAFAACGDEQPTAPVTSKQTLAADQAPSGQIIAIGKTRLNVTIVQAEEPYGGGNAQGGLTKAICPVGSQAVGGGYVLDGAGWKDMKIIGSAPAADGWMVAVENLGAQANLKVYATCVQ